MFLDMYEQRQKREDMFRCSEGDQTTNISGPSSTLKQCHILDDNLRDDHITVMIKHIARLYLQLFLYQFGKVCTERVVKENKASKRHALTKQILFYNE